MREEALFVSCTRGRKEDTELFRWLSRLGLRVNLQFFEHNTEGLSARYNSVLDHVGDTDTWVIFVHDDVRISDPDIVNKLRATAASADAAIIGVAGSNAFSVDSTTPFLMWNQADRAHWSGNVGVAAPGSPLFFGSFGPAPRRCVVIDGLLIAVRPRGLRGVRFDEQFSFHFYDLDFCLSATEAGVGISTSMPMGIIHCSIGRVTVHSEAFNTAQRGFLAKWRGKAFSV